VCSNAIDRELTLARLPPWLFVAATGTVNMIINAWDTSGLSESLYTAIDCASSSLYSLSNVHDRLACQWIKNPDGSVQKYHKVTCTDQCANVDCGAHGTCGAGGECTCNSGYTGAACDVPPTPTPTPSTSSGGSGTGVADGLSGTIFSDRTCSTTGTNNIVFTDWKNDECTPIGNSFLKMSCSSAAATFSIWQYDDAACTSETANQGILTGQYCCRGEAG
jgi:hypothetical protein